MHSDSMRGGRGFGRGADTGAPAAQQTFATGRGGGNFGSASTDTGETGRGRGGGRTFGQGGGFFDSGPKATDGGGTMGFDRGGTAFGSSNAGAKDSTGRGAGFGGRGAGFGTGAQDSAGFGGGRGEFGTGAQDSAGRGTSFGAGRGGGFGTGAQESGGFGGGRGEFGTMAQDSAGRGTGLEGGRGGGFGTGANAGAPPPAEGAETRPPRYRPPTRPVEEIFKEDQDNAERYSRIVDEDEDFIISGHGAVVGSTVVLDTWKDAKLNEKLYENIVQKAMYVRPRKIQAHAIPHILEGVDVKGHAETGSGKTLAFLVPIIQKITEMDRSGRTPLAKPAPIALIIEPTRELCLQVYEQGTKLADGLDVKVTKAYGQYSVSYNLLEINFGCDILCVTFGRLLHFIRNGIIKLDRLKFLVLDEADRLLQEENVRELLQGDEFPKNDQRQTMLFSATFPAEVQELADNVLRKDHIFVNNRKLISANLHIRQEIMEVGADAKADVLVQLLTDEFDKAKAEGKLLRRTLVFVQTKRDADRIGLYLATKGIPATTINGDRSQSLREEALRDLRSSKVSVLVTTDVCARGIDIKELDHVIIFDLPQDIHTYIHRIGRTGRIGPGDATAFFDSSKDASLADDLAKLLIEAKKEVPAFLTGGTQQTTAANVNRTDAWDDDWDVPQDSATAAAVKQQQTTAANVSRNDAWDEWGDHAAATVKQQQTTAANVSRNDAWDEWSTANVNSADDPWAEYN